MRHDTIADRKEKDFLGYEFIEYKCSRCRKRYNASRFSLGSRTCPPCSNPETKSVDPDDLLQAIESLTDETML